MLDEKSLFISHAEKDSKFIEKFIDLLYDIGIPEKNIFCSSTSELGIPITKDIYEYLRNLLVSEYIIPVFMLSDNYYSSAACLNEMGAVWIKQIDYFTFLLPDFKFSQIKGAVNPSKKGISLWYNSEKELQSLKENLNQFRDQICDIFNIDRHKNWERKRDNFINEIRSIKAKISVININLKECEGFCIGEYEHNGCLVVFDDTTNKICSTIDFSKTEAAICSIVVFVSELNISYQYNIGKKIFFELKATNIMSDIEIECRLKHRNVRKKIAVSSGWETYSIPLYEFGGNVSEWEALQEIKFLLRRKDILCGKIEIKNICIK